MTYNVFGGTLNLTQLQFQLLQNKEFSCGRGDHAMLPNSNCENMEWVNFREKLAEKQS